MSTSTRIKIIPPALGVRGEICIDGTCFTWPDPSIGFKPQVEGWRRPKFPCVVLGGNWGRQLVYEKASQNTYYENAGPAFWLYPLTGQYPFAGAEEIVDGLEDKRVLGVAKKINTLVSMGLLPGDGVQIPAATMHLNDLYMDPEATAFTRSVYLTNLPVQPTGVSVAKLYQANSKETFNGYLEQLKGEGWNGVWVRPNDSIWGDPEFFVREPL